MGASGNNPETLVNDEQVEEIQEDVIEEVEETIGQDSTEFTEISLEDIDRNSLSPELQSAYDQVSEMKANMQRDYTRKTQNLSELRKSAGNWNMVEQNPVLSRIMSDALNKMNQGLPLESPENVPAATTSPEDDPKAFIANIVSEQLTTALKPIMSQLGSVTNFVQTNQQDVEWENLKATYPAAKLMDVSEVNEVRMQYRDTKGNPISMQKAYALMCADNPDYLKTSTAVKTKPTARKPVVENNKASVNSTRPVEVPAGVQNLQKQIADIEKDGKGLSLGDAVKRAYIKMSTLAR